MKKVFYILVAALIAAVSCDRSLEFNDAQEAGEQGLTLRFSCGDMATRATVDGVSNENLIKQIDYFLFPVNSEGKVTDDTEYAYKGQFTPEDNGLALQYEVTIEPEKLTKIFPDGAKNAVVFAVANYVDKFGAAGNEAGTAPAIESPVTTLPEDVKTWKGLHELEVGPTFFKDGGVVDADNEFLLRWPRVMQPDEQALFFVMTADSVNVNLNTAGQYAIDAEIPLKRLASKVTVDFEYENYVETKHKTDGDEVITWVPQSEGEEARVYLSNGIEHATLGGPLPADHEYVADGWGSATKPLGNGTRDLFEYAYDFMTNIAVVEGKKTAHYYTYPIATEEGDDNQPYLKLVLPWYGYKWVGEGDAPEEFDPANTGWRMYKQKEVYYKIVLPRETIKDPNCIYQYHVKVNIIGSDREVKVIGEEYVIKDWSSDRVVGSSVATGRYISLDIPRDEYEMYTDEIEIVFVSSGDVTPVVEEIYQWDYSGTTPTKDYFMQDDAVTTDEALLNSKGFTAEDVEGWVSIPAGTSYLKINHALCNDMDVDPISIFDAAPYVYKVRLHLDAAGDDTAFDRTVIVTQYPAMYIQAETNSAYSASETYGYVYVNGQQNTTNNNWYLVSGLSGTNSNPNMFIITSTILSDENMMLADPRKTTIQNGYSSNDNSWSPEMENIYNPGTDTRLNYYYPTDDSDIAKKMVSPKFRIASSYGKTYPVNNRQNAWQRCASYQEDGYPAGRWRIPTTAEVKYVVNLSANGFMDILFGNPRTQNESTNYWTSTGYVTVNNYTKTVDDNDGSPSGNQNVYVRCVYDDWYWADKAPDKTEPVWGDKRR